MIRYEKNIPLAPTFKKSDDFFIVMHSLFMTNENNLLVHVQTISRKLFFTFFLIVVYHASSGHRERELQSSLQHIELKLFLCHFNTALTLE